MRKIIPANKYSQSIKSKLNEFVRLFYQGKILRFTLFIFLYILARYINIQIDNTMLANLVLSPLYKYSAFIVLKLSSFVLKPFFPDIHVSSNVIIISQKPILILYSSCTGINQILRLCFILLFYPIRWQNKLWLYPITIIILLVASTLHFIFLIPFANNFINFFTFAHNWASKFIFYFFYFLCWIIWECTPTSILWNKLMVQLGASLIKTR